MSDFIRYALASAIGAAIATYPMARWVLREMDRRIERAKSVFALQVKR